MNPTNCPLCSYPTVTCIGTTAGRKLERCDNCDLVSIDSNDQLTRDAERARYLLHRNSLEDSDYRTFLSRLADPVCARKSPMASVLDFGSGPSPVMAELFKSRGYDVQLFDPFFAPDRHVLNQKYDIVLCCETAEHFRDVNGDWSSLAGCLNPDGVLGVMTLLHDENTDWSRWWYAQDPTHICFYSIRTMDWIGKHFGFEIDVLDERVAIFYK